MRDHFWYLFLPILFPHYNKNSHNKEVETQQVVRTLPPQINTVVLSIIFHIRPCELILASLAKVIGAPEIAVGKVKLFWHAGKLLHPQAISSLLSMYTERYMGHSLGLRQVRHLQPILSRRLLLRDPNVMDSWRNLMEEQAGHSVKTAESVYGRANQIMTDRQMSASIVLSTMWQQVSHVIQ